MNKRIFLKFLSIVLISGLIGISGLRIGFNINQAIASSILILSILGSLFFWEQRLAIVFFGVAILLATRTIDIENFVMASSLEVILFLIGMMVIVGLLKELGVFAWVVSLIIRIKALTGAKFVVAISIISALSACALDEVTSIIFIVAAILEICDYFEIDPVPYIIMSVMATNIGSSGTVLGNPIGILIASKSGLTFEDFLIRAFPIMCIILAIAIGLFLIIFRKSIREFSEKVRMAGANEFLIRLISVPPDLQLRIGLGILGATLFFIMLHHRIEEFLGLGNNTILLMVPLVSAGAIMLWKFKNARKYIEEDVEWWTLLFFIMLFGITGTLRFTGATDILAKDILRWTQNSQAILSGVMLWASTIGSSVLDNVVLVAAFIPIIQSFRTTLSNTNSLWWALLFGGCLGGNITMIGSTANIVALGILEKEKNFKMNFFRWLGVGLLVGLVTTTVAWAGIALLGR